MHKSTAKTFYLFISFHLFQLKKLKFDLWFDVEDINGYIRYGDAKGKGPTQYLKLPQLACVHY